jgi:hypothetical protein
MVVPMKKGRDELFQERRRVKLGDRHITARDTDDADDAGFRGSIQDRTVFF